MFVLRFIKPLWLVVVSMVLIGVAACGSDSSSDSENGGGDWETVTISGAFGDDEVTQKPQKVLALTPTDADILLSIGVTPMVIPSSAQTDAATDGTGMYPWQKELYPEGTEKVMIEADGVTAEDIAALEPDLIVATTFFGLDQEVYDKLSAIAPVVHFVTGANEDSWQESTRRIAEAVGKSAEADEAIETAEAALAQAKADYPELEGKVYNAIISPTPDTLSILCSDTDNLARVLDEIGMKVSEYATSMSCPGGKQPIAWENIFELDADVVWAIPDTEDQMAELADNPVWNSLAAVQRGAVVVVPKTTGVPFALSFPSPLSLEWSTNQLVPQFAEAVANS